MSQKNHKKRQTHKQFMQQELLENKICSAVGQMLEKHYPGWVWFVEARIDTGVCTIKNLALHGDYGFIIHLNDLVNDPELKCVVIAAGELLERCGLPRGRKPDNISNELMKDRDVRGNLTTMDTHGAED